jgi:hypothetical protein
VPAPKPLRPLWLITAVCLSGVAHAQFFCPAPAYVSRPASVPKPMSWKVAGAYGVSAASTGDVTIAADINGDGQKEILTPGVQGTVWQAFGYSSRTGGYEVVHSEPSRLPFGPFDQTSAGWLSVDALTPGGPLKIISGSRFQINDLATLKVDVIGASDLGIGRTWVRDIDRDGTPEIVGEGGVIVDTAFSRYISAVHPELGALLGQFDADANYEMLSPAGLLAEWRDGRWVEDQRIVLDANRHLITEVSDIDGDGVDELVHVVDGTSVRVHDFVERRSLWEVAVGVGQNTVRSVEVADVNGDGDPDVVVITDGIPPSPGEIVALDGRTGARLWSFNHPAIAAGGLLIDNVDDDPGREIVYTAGFPFTGPFQIYVHDLGTRAREWLQPQEAWPVRALAVGNLTASAGSEVILAPSGVIGTGDTRFYVRDIGRLNPLEDLESAQLPTFTAAGVHALAVADVMGDASPELIVGTDNEMLRSRLYVYSWPGRVLLRTYELETTSVVIEIATADLDDDGDLEIVAGTGLQAIPRIHAIDARADTILWSSPELHDTFGLLPSMKVRDIDGDGLPEIFAGGAELVIFNGATRAETRIPGGPYYGFDVADATGDGVQDIVAGAVLTNGSSDLVVFTGPSWTASQRINACPDLIHAVAWNVFESSRRQAFFSCQSQIRVADLASGTHQPVTEPTATEIGLQNHLFPVRTAANEPRLLAGAKFGAYSFSPTANLRPVVAPTNVCSPQRFLKHWRESLRGVLTFQDADGDPLTASIERAPSFGPWIVDTSEGNFRLFFDTSTAVGPDLFSLRVNDGTEESPLAISTIWHTNSPPTLTGTTTTVRSGEVALGGLPTQDSQNDFVGYEVVQAPANGTLTLDSGLFRYQPAAAFTGTDTFLLRAFDQMAFSPVATFTIVVEAVPPANPPPPPPPSNPNPGSSGGSGGGGLIDPLWLLLLGLLLRRGRTPRRL